MLDKPIELQAKKPDEDSTRVIRLEESRKAKVYSIKLDVVCNICGKTWGVKLLPDYTMPMAWFECLNCKKNKNVNQPLVKSGEVQDERTAEQN